MSKKEVERLLKHNLDPCEYCHYNVDDFDCEKEMPCKNYSAFEPLGDDYRIIDEAIRHPELSVFEIEEHLRESEEVDTHLDCPRCGARLDRSETDEGEECWECENCDEQYTPYSDE